MNLFETMKCVHDIANQQLLHYEKSVNHIKKKKEEIKQVLAFYKAEPNQESFKDCVAVDSAFAPIHKDAYSHNIYAIVVQAIGIGMNVVDEDYDLLQEDKCDLVEENSEIDHILSAFGLGYEVMMANSLLDNYDCILMDGSVITFMSSIKKIFGFIKNYGQTQTGKKIQEKFPIIVENLHNLLSSKKAIFVPKKSRRNEFLESLANTDIGDEAWKSLGDRFVLQHILDTKEYIELPIEHYTYYVDSIEQADRDKLEELVYLVNEMKVCYFKGMSGMVYKIEYSQEIPVHSIYPLFITPGENLLSYEADKFAKKELNLLIEGNPLKGLWKYRMKSSIHTV